LVSEQCVKSEGIFIQKDFRIDGCVVCWLKKINYEDAKCCLILSKVIRQNGDYETHVKQGGYVFCS